MPRIALYAGSFDPVTNGHLDVVRHAAHVLGGVHIGEPNDDRYRAVEELATARDAINTLARDLLGFRHPIEATATLKGIGRVTFRGLQPLWLDVVNALRERGIEIPLHGPA